MLRANFLRSFVAACLLIVAIGVIQPSPAFAATSTRANEKAFVKMLNALRVKKGVRPLQVDYRLRNVARNWSLKMARKGDISHNSRLASQLPREWEIAGENVGVGTGVDVLHNAFVKSKHHYVNMVNRKYNAVGIGVVHQGGKIWVSVEFMLTRRTIPRDPELPRRNSAVRVKQATHSHNLGHGAGKSVGKRSSQKHAKVGVSSKEGAAKDQVKTKSFGTHRGAVNNTNAGRSATAASGSTALTTHKGFLARMLHRGASKLFTWRHQSGLRMLMSLF